MTVYVRILKPCSPSFSKQIKQDALILSIFCFVFKITLATVEAHSSCLPKKKVEMLASKILFFNLVLF